MIKLKKGPNGSSLFGMIWVGGILAMIFTLPGLGALFLVHHYTDSWLLGLVPVIILHITTLVFSVKISKTLTKIILEDDQT